MAFRKRNVPVNGAALRDEAARVPTARPTAAPGTKPSLLTSSSVTSTGTAELDALLGGHGGLSLGSSLLLGEHGTTDYAGALLRAFAAEGLLQGHHIHVVGADKSWSHNLPGPATDGDKDKHVKDTKPQDSKMKIAWRYENLERPSQRGLPVRGNIAASSAGHSPQADVPFCHTFDLTKRLGITPEHKIEYLSIGQQPDPLSYVIDMLSRDLSSSPSSPSSTVHRIVIPLLLSPLYYPAACADPGQVLHFMHALKALLCKHASSAVAMISIPLSLYPRSCGTVRWIEHLSDGLMELTPFPYIAGVASTSEGKGDTAQGMLKVVKLPMSTDRGEGGASAGNTIGDDLAFTLSRRKFVIEPYSLPPVEGDQEAQQEAGKLTAKDVEF